MKIKEIGLRASLVPHFGSATGQGLVQGVDCTGDPSPLWTDRHD